MDYSNFEIEDFATDEAFINWVLAPDAEADRFWANFLANHPSAARKVEEARELVLHLRDSEQLSSTPRRASALWSRIEPLLDEGRPARSFWSFSSWKIAATVSIVLVTCVGTYFFFQGNAGNDSTHALRERGDFIEALNTSGSVLSIYLSDGSVVSLETNSHLRYPRYFTGRANREVFLTGEGFFDVAKNAQQPFLVHTQQLTTKVLGTSFRIKAYEGERNIVVAVKEGKVSVFSSTDTKNDQQRQAINGVVLIPNQQVTYSLSENSFTKTLVENPEKVTPSSESSGLAFENTPAKEVFKSLEAIYGVKIIFDEEIMENCYLTVKLGEEPLYEKLHIICRTIGATYELIEATVVISGKGC